VDTQVQEFADKSVSYAINEGASYCDVRADVVSKNGFIIENGQIEHFTNRKELGLGIRVLNEGAWGFFSISQPKNFESVKLGIFDALKSASHSSKKRKQKIKISSIPSFKTKVNFPIKKEPSIEELIKIGFECDKRINSKKRIIKSQVSMSYSKFSKYFVNNEGAKINQNFTDTVAEITATAHESGLTESVNTTEGGRGGIEKLSNGTDIIETADFISEKASNLIDAKPAKEEMAPVIMNPDFVALLTHEILGHPSEADRVLGKEMAWAGGAWWKGKIGEQIGSDFLNVFDDPTIKGSLGWYEFDDEGNKASRTNLIENGILKLHMQSRETAEIFQTNPTSNMRATSFRYMPLIRMACTCIDKGDWNPEEMIKDVKEGYLISNMKIPSIDMKRYNWSISCQYAHKIINGEVTDLLRDVIVLGTAPEFFKSIDACGNDFTVRPITNCGKGDPMQSMMMGNGGPSIRAMATVRSVN
jgi:TldD protein